MYAVKVEQGRERPKVRKISTGFLPTYRVYTGSAAELEAENAVLRKQVGELTAKLEKAKKTLAGVMDEI